jgi:hypothetical protein
MIMTTEPETIIEPKVELQTISPPTATDELSEVNRAAQALVDALKGLAQVKIQSATDLTEETHHSIDRCKYCEIKPIEAGILLAS